jgi:hypothetical protein
LRGSGVDLPESIQNVRLTALINFNGSNHYLFLRPEMNSNMNQQATAFQKTRAEQETENEANRLIEQVESALAIVAVRSPVDDDSLSASADRIERAARDFADALRQLSQHRKDTEQGS